MSLMAPAATPSREELVGGGEERRNGNQQLLSAMPYLHAVELGAGGENGNQEQHSASASAAYPWV